MMPKRPPERIDVLQGLHNACKSFVDSALPLADYLSESHGRFGEETLHGVFRKVIKLYSAGKLFISDHMSAHAYPKMYHVRVDQAASCIKKALQKAYGSSAIEHEQEVKDRICRVWYQKKIMAEFDMLEKEVAHLVTETMKLSHVVAYTPVTHDAIGDALSRALKQFAQKAMPDAHEIGRVELFLRKLLSATEEELPKPFREPPNAYLREW